MREIQDNQLSQSRQPLPNRRALLAGAGVTCAAMLAGCSTHDASNGGSTPGTSGPAGALTATSQVPEGGGEILATQRMVITQPQSGSFKAFSSICTHEGCFVTSVSDGTINCPCHGSKFSITDGSVVHGPATRPLPAIAINVQGTSIFPG